MPPSLPLLLVVGDPAHGVAEYAADLARATRALAPHVELVEVPDAGTAGRVAAAAARVHLHVTERVFGGSPEAAADAIERIGAATALTVTLHDVPQPSDGAPLPRRIAAYRRMLAVADGAVVNSAHEQALVRAELGFAGELGVIPLGARRARAPEAPPVVRRLEAALAGYVYPGKGHLPALHAVAQARDLLRADGDDPGDAVVRAIGGASRGHEADLDALRSEARALGVGFAVTGFLDSDAFVRELKTAPIPLAAHEHVSASRSILDWGEAGRRPLVLRSRYTEETAALRPGTLALYDADALAAALADAWRHPESTVLATGAALGPTLDDVAAAYLTWWQAR